MSVKVVIIVTLVVLMWLTESAPTIDDGGEDYNIIRSSPQQEDHPTELPLWEVLFDKIRSLMAKTVNSSNRKKFLRFG